MGQQIERVMANIVLCVPGTKSSDIQVPLVGTLEPGTGCLKFAQTSYAHRLLTLGTTELCSSCR